MTSRLKNPLLFVVAIVAFALTADAERERHRLCGVQLVRHTFSVCQSPCMPTDSEIRQFRGGLVYNCCSAAGCTDDFIRDFCCAVPDNEVVGRHKFALNGPFKPRNPVSDQDSPLFRQALFKNHVGNELPLIVAG
ncbi:hypothetical protein AAVH_16479 [Aphelenchoides avenae]|nr:hypothetical protein AAVH_16479 [Aphelenchus avenae]